MGSRCTSRRKTSTGTWPAHTSATITCCWMSRPTRSSTPSTCWRSGYDASPARRSLVSRPRHDCSDGTLGGRHRIARPHPRLDPPLESLDVGEPLRLVLRRLTGGSRLGGSGAVKDDLLVCGQRRQRRLEPPERHRAFQLDLLTLLLVFVAAHEQRAFRSDLLSSLLNADARNLWHGFLLSGPDSGRAGPVWSNAKRFDGKPTFPPALEAAEQRPDTRLARPPKLERRPGARRFVRSRAVQNDLAVTRQLALSPLDLLGGDPERARDRVGHGLHVERRSQVEDDHLLSSVELLFQLVRRDPGDSEKAEKAAPPSVLDDDIRPEGGTRHRQRRRTQMRDLLRRDALEHIAEEIPETCPRPRPGQPARTGIEEEPRRPEAKDAGQGGGDRVQPREKFCEQQSSSPPREKDLLRAPNAGIGLERERAQPRERAVATPPPEGVPEHVGDERGTRGKANRDSQVCASDSGQGTGRDEHGDSRDRPPHLIHEDPHEKDEVAVPLQELERFSHGDALRSWEGPPPSQKLHQLMNSPLFFSLCRLSDPPLRLTLLKVVLVKL